MSKCDVIVVGGGNAGLCAAIAARQAGSQVTLLEKAPLAHRGGNSSLTMNFRFTHACFEDLLSLVDTRQENPRLIEAARRMYRSYTAPQFAQELQQASGDQADPSLTSAIAQGSWPTIAWLRTLGHEWEFKPPQFLMDSSPLVRLKGSGRALQEKSFQIAEALGVTIIYGAQMVRMACDEQARPSLVFLKEGQEHCMQAEALILACGGFEASPSMRANYLGEAWKDVIVRGVPYNTGEGLQAALEIGARKAGDFHSCHSTPQSAVAAAYMLPGGNAESQFNSRYRFLYGITVNRQGRRFVDEGEDYPNFVYAKLGAAILAHPGQMAFQIFDSLGFGHLSEGYFKDGCLLRSTSLRQLASACGIDEDGLVQEIASYNRAICTTGEQAFDRNASAEALTTPRKHWAQPISQAPFYASPVKAGITFTYGGLAIQAQDARVIREDGHAFSRLFACGEIVGGVFSGGYPGGSGLISGAHFGRTAGLAAASLCKAG